MSLWGMSWFEAIGVTLAILALQVLSCLLVERSPGRRRGGDSAPPHAEASPGTDRQKRAA